MQQFTRKPRRGEESVSLVVGSRQPRRRILVLCEQAKSWGTTQFKDCIFKTNKQTKLTLKTTEFFMQYRKRLLLCRSRWCCSKCRMLSRWRRDLNKMLHAALDPGGPPGMGLMPTRWSHLGAFDPGGPPGMGLIPTRWSHLELTWGGPCTSRSQEAVAQHS